MAFWEKQLLTALNKAQLVASFASQLPHFNDQIIQLFSDENELTQEVAEVVQLNSRISETGIRANERLKQSSEQHAKRSESEQGSAEHTEQHAKLPKLEVAHFTGNPLEWQGFWNYFETTIDRSKMADIQKLTYLKSYLEGDALKAVDGFRLTADNYRIVVDTLIERFGNSEMAKFAHIEQLLALPSAEKDPGNLKTIYNDCEKHIRSLVALGVSEDTFGFMFSPIILSKLPRTTRTQMQRLNGSKPWELATLRDERRNHGTRHERSIC